jgi:hypothetical protein
MKASSSPQTHHLQYRPVPTQIRKSPSKASGIDENKMCRAVEQTTEYKSQQASHNYQKHAGQRSKVWNRTRMSPLKGIDSQKSN